MHKSALLLFAASRLGMLHLTPSEFLPIYEQYSWEEDMLIEQEINEYNL